MFAHATERDFASARVDATLQRHAQRARLLEDFLEHEVLELAEFNLLKIEFQLANLGSQRHIVDCRGAETLARDARNRIVRKHDRLCGVRDDCARITCDHEFTVADPDHQRRTLARHDENIWFLLTHHRDRIRTSHFTQRCLHSLLQIAAIQLANEMREHFGVGLTRERVPLFLEVLLDRRVVLDDAVVDNRDAVTMHAVIAMRMRVLLRDTAVRCPARMRNADGS